MIKTLPLAAALMMGTATLFAQSSKNSKSAPKATAEAQAIAPAGGAAAVPSTDERRPKDPAAMAAKRAAGMQKKLGLTDEQRAKVEAILKNEATQIQALRKPLDDQHQKLKPQIDAIRSKSDADLKAAIGDEKFAQVQKMRDERKHGHHGHHGHDGPDGPPAGIDPSKDQ